MSRNIKEIGKELMGKSLSSYHRKTGLPQLEKNNEMQDGILNGILSQVDDAYIEKTEQSNVIHLDGSGDGVVVLDSIEGNTLVNCIRFNKTISNATTVDNNIYTFTRRSLTETNTSAIFDTILKDNTTYTIAFDILKNDYSSSDYSEHRIEIVRNANVGFAILLPANSSKGYYKRTFTTNFSSNAIGDSTSQFWVGVQYSDFKNKTDILGDIIIGNIVVLEGDWTNKEIPPYLEGLQSSFEEKINENGEYKIEILSNNKNLFDMSKTESGYIEIYTEPNIGKIVQADCLNRTSDFIKVKPSTKYTYIATVPVTNANYATWSRVSYYDRCKNYISSTTIGGKELSGIQTDILTTTTPSTCEYVRVGSRYLEDNNAIVSFLEGSHSEHCLLEQNKIKLLINEPLRAIGDIKDRLCVKDGRLVVERNYGEYKYKGIENICTYGANGYNKSYFIIDTDLKTNGSRILCDKLKSTIQSWASANEGLGAIRVNEENRILYSHLLTQEEFKANLNSLLPTYVFQLAEPYYEEVTNEYGEPILLEGYENGTLYIDSTIIPTTTVRYTPKMESFNTLKEVSNNNVMLTTDINDTIIPYMMEVDLMIMEKEMSLFNSLNKNIRKIGEEDMTSMQKRTGEMLERLIKGKSLNEQECKTRVTVYLNAGKITDEQAEELMLLISEIYA